MVRLQDIILTVIAYLIGSVPTSVWIGKRFFSTDVRKHGSGNSGATNTLRTLGKKAGIVVLIIDILKGWVAVGLIYFSSYGTSDPHRIHLEVALACAAIIGHILPIYAGFKGGKGVATTLGIILAFSPEIAFLGVVVFALILFISHYVSLASIISISTFPLWMVVFKKMAVSHWLLAFSIFLPLLVIFMHRKNIIRLLNGQESKLNLFKKPAPGN